MEITPWIVLTAVLLVAAGVAVARKAGSADAATSISASDAVLQQQQGALMVDVRTPAEWAEGHVAGAVLLPLQDLQRQSEKGLPTVADAGPIVLYCRSGRRAAVAAGILRQKGYTQVLAVSGGFDDLRRLGLPTN